MKTHLVIAIVIASSAVVLSAQAQTYQWKDSSGRTVISDTPPAGPAKGVQASGTAPRPTSTVVADKAPAAEKTPDAAKTTAEKDMDFKKRQQEAKEKADKDAKEQAAAADKKENCERARRNVIALESGQPLAQLDENGQRKVMDTTQRDQELDRARKFVTETCR